MARKIPKSSMSEDVEGGIRFSQLKPKERESMEKSGNRIEKRKEATTGHKEIQTPHNKAVGLSDTPEQEPAFSHQEIKAGGKLPGQVIGGNPQSKIDSFSTEQKKEEGLVHVGPAIDEDAQKRIAYFLKHPEKIDRERDKYLEQMREEEKENKEKELDKNVLLFLAAKNRFATLRLKDKLEEEVDEERQEVIKQNIEDRESMPAKWIKSFAQDHQLTPAEAEEELAQINDYGYLKNLFLEIGQDKLETFKACAQNLDKLVELAKLKQDLDQASNVKAKKAIQKQIEAAKEPFRHQIAAFAKRHGFDHKTASRELKKVWDISYLREYETEKTNVTQVIKCVKKSESLDQFTQQDLSAALDALRERIPNGDEDTFKSARKIEVALIEKIRGAGAQEGKKAPTAHKAKVKKSTAAKKTREEQKENILPTDTQEIKNIMEKEEKEKTRVKKRYAELIEYCNADENKIKQRLEREPGAWEKFKKVYKKIGEYNVNRLLNKFGIESDSKLLSMVNPRTALSLMIIGVGVGAIGVGAVGGAGAFSGLVITKRLLAGAGSASFSYDLMTKGREWHAEKKKGDLAEVFTNEKELDKKIKDKKRQLSTLKKEETKNPAKKAVLALQKHKLKSQIEKLEERKIDENEFYLDDIDQQMENKKDLREQLEWLYDRRNKLLAYLSLDGKNVKENESYQRINVKIESILKTEAETRSQKWTDFLDGLSHKEGKNWEKVVKKEKRKKKIMKTAAIGIGAIVSGSMWIKDILAGTEDVGEVPTTEADKPMGGVTGADRPTGETPAKPKVSAGIDKTLKPAEDLPTTGETPEPKAFEPVYEGQLEDATVPEGKGVIYALQKQLEAEPEKFGYNPETDGPVGKWANARANNIAFNQGYEEIGVKEADKVAYILQEDGTIKEVNAITGEKIGQAGPIPDEHEYKYEPPKEAAPKVAEAIPASKLDIDIQPQFEGELTTFEQVLEDRYENPENYVMRGMDAEDVQKNAVEALEKHLTQPENLENIEQNIEKIKDVNLLQELSQSENESLTEAAETAQAELLKGENTVEKINNLLEIKNPNLDQVENLRDLISTAAKEHANAIPQESALFSQFIVQSKEKFPEIFGKKVGDEYIKDWFEAFKEEAGKRDVPTKANVWTPRTFYKGGESHIINIMPKGHVGGKIEYLIDPTGDGQGNNTVSSNVIQKLIQPEEPQNVIQKQTSNFI